MPAQARHDTMERILDAAYRCLASRGYASVSMRQIALEAGVALSQLHYYFHSKERLFLEVLFRTTEQHRREVQEWVSRPDVQERLRGLAGVFQTKLREDPGWFRLLFDFASLAFQDSNMRKYLRQLFTQLAHDAENYMLPPSKGPWPPGESRGRTLVAVLYGLALQALMEAESAGQPSQLPAWVDEALQSLVALC
ncbi:MAG: TetR/AcrR family transcriptional regulator [Firmicutes bacterium]|nr:TetR/AcrR family transcriptional regulator [Bacillota bacterium]